MQQAATPYNLVFTEYPDVVGVDELRKMLGNISKKSAYKLIKDNKIEAYKIGKGYRIPKLSILTYLNMGE